MALLRFLVKFRRGLRDAEFRALFVSLISLLLTGTIFYSTVEGWTWLDALYFSVMTLSTVGYGDLHPTVPVSKIFTIIYVVIGVGLFVAFITKVAEQRPHRGRKDDES
jgi:hypothetical protein